MDEVWKDIIINNDFTGYKISDFGNVKCVETNFILKPINHTTGYKKTRLSRYTRKDFYIHRLMAITFIPNPENKPQVNHINGVKSDNKLNNLEWTTRSENMIHAFKTGLQVCSFIGIKGKDHHGSKKVIQRTKDGYVIKIWDAISDAVRSGNGFRCSQISLCCNGKRKSHQGFIWDFVY